MMDGMATNHRLFNMLMSATEVTESEIEELFSDLKFVFENPFETLIEEAMSQRQCTYIEVTGQRGN